MNWPSRKGAFGRQSWGVEVSLVWLEQRMCVWGGAVVQRWPGPCRCCVDQLQESSCWGKWGWWEDGGKSGEQAQGLGEARELWLLPTVGGKELGNMGFRKSVVEIGSYCPLERWVMAWLLQSNLRLRLYHLLTVWPRITYPRALHLCFLIVRGG